MPLPVQSIVLGISGGSPNTTAARPAAAHSSEIGSSFCPAHWISARPTATRAASAISRFFSSCGSSGASFMCRSGNSTSTPPIAITGSTDQNTQCHELISTIQPANGGPMNAGSIQQAENQVISVARSFSSKARAISTITATFIVPAPRPWMNRAASSTHMLGARAARTRPTAKMEKPQIIGWTGP